MSEPVNNMINLDRDDNIEEMYLLFNVTDEEYGVGIQHVTEIVGLQKIIEVPDVPHYIKGVINLRGKVIPVMDVRQRFNMDVTDYDDRTVLIVLEVNDVPTGLVVDKVNEVIDIPDNQIDPPPQSQNGIAQSVIKGMAKLRDRVSIILDVEKLLYTKEGVEI